MMMIRTTPVLNYFEDGFSHGRSFRSFHPDRTTDIRSYPAQCHILEWTHGFTASQLFRWTQGFASALNP